ncbi:Bacitracin synthase 1 [Orchesella cincta]|uniref:diacylglycerol O-acyltransferase n=1 Tax=Orchesella cincta TaxID=48709 RepID=A0A1D2MWE0_ORCCI|nr:Bacitracin synthase 1 [Orchesella cincta]
MLGLECNYYYPGRYELASGKTAYLGVKLHGSSKSYIHGYKIIRGVPDMNRICAKLQEVFTKTSDKFGYFCWDKKVPFDVTKHVRLLDDFDPEEIVDEARLVEICSKLAPRDCGEEMPQWEVLMIPKFRMAGELEDEEITHYALIVRIHHAYCDGISYVLLVNNFLADVPGELPIDPTKGFNNAVWIKVYIWAKILTVGPMNFFTNLGMLLVTKSMYGVERYSLSKIFAKSSVVGMDKLRKLRLASGTSVTSITIAAVFAALNKTHLRLWPGKPVPKTLHLASVGVMLPYTEEKRLVNQFTMWPYTAPLKVDDPKKRLAKTYEEVRRCASQPDPVFDFYMQRALGSLPKFLHKILFNLSGTPIMLSNVPGYKTSVKLLEGDGIGISTQSYCGRIHFSAISDPKVIPNATELRMFLEEIVNQIDIMAKAYSPSEDKADGLLALGQSDAEKSNLHKMRDANDNEATIRIFFVIIQTIYVSG